MIKYHGLPITPATAAVAAVHAGHAFVSFSAPDQLGTAIVACQSFAIDNGAFTAWKAGRPVTNWSPYYAWADMCRKIPSCDFAVIPDVIDGDEASNDALLEEWPLPRWFGVPVWHMHESIDRLNRLVDAGWPRVALGSSGEYSKVGDARWWRRMGAAMDAVCDEYGQPKVKLHGLRMLNPSVFCHLPLASADSTNIGRNVGIDRQWSSGRYLPPTKEARAAVMRARIESVNATPTWGFEINRDWADE
jgi:hypothetical protein